MLLLVVFGFLEAKCLDTLRVDLKPIWLSNSENGFVPFNASGNVVHLPVNEMKGIALEVSSKKPFHIFLNNRLIERDIKKFHRSLEVMQREAGEAGIISILSNSGFADVETVSVQVLEENGFAGRKATVSSFIIMAGVLLAAYFIVLIRTQPSLTLEYLNVSKIFGLRYFEETQHLRITSVSNIFFYVFSALLAAVVLFVFNRGSEVVAMSFGKSLGQVVLVTTILLAVLLIKAVLLKFTAALFGLSDFNSKQFQDFPKTWLISFGICAIMLTVLVMFGADWHAWIRPLEYFVLMVQLVFVVAVYLKLIGHGGFTAFHLFSYLCATEIIPLIILLNVYFF